MSDWMLKGINNVSLDGFIMFASLEQVSGVYLDVSHSPYVAYRKLVDYFAYVVCVDDQDEKRRVVNTLKMCGIIVK